MKMNNNTYYDDRIYLMYVCKCVVTHEENMEITNLYHEEAAEGFNWAVAIRENSARYKILDVIHLQNEDEARDFFRLNAPMTPRVSLGGDQPKEQIDYTDYKQWLEDNNLEEYNYRKVFSPDAIGKNPRERLYKQLS